MSDKKLEEKKGTDRQKEICKAGEESLAKGAQAPATPPTKPAEK